MGVMGGPGGGCLGGERKGGGGVKIGPWVQAGQGSKPHLLREWAAGGEGGCWGGCAEGQGWGEG